MQQQNADLTQQLGTANTPAGDVEKVKANFKVPKGEEGYVHAYVTHKNGVPVATPQVEPYYPNVYKTLKDTPGFTAHVLHQPGK